MITRYRFSLLDIVGGHGIFKKWIFFSHKLILKFQFFNIKFWGLECAQFENGIFQKPYFTLKFFLTYEIFFDSLDSFFFIFIALPVC